MKRLFFTLFALCCLTYLAQAQSTKIQRTTSGGGIFGYKNTSQTWSGSCCVIKCSEPGWTACPDKCLTQNPAFGSLVDQADQAIAGGTLSGSISDSVAGATVTWVATPNSEGGFDSDIVVVEHLE